jgi:hypothetical protein
MVDGWMVDGWMGGWWMVDGWMVDEWMVYEWMVDGWMLYEWMVDGWVYTIRGLTYWACRTTLTHLLGLPSGLPPSILLFRRALVLRLLPVLKRPLRVRCSRSTVQHEYSTA